MAELARLRIDVAPENLDVLEGILQGTPADVQVAAEFQHCGRLIRAGQDKIACLADDTAVVFLGVTGGFCR